MGRCLCLKVTIMSDPTRLSRVEFIALLAMLFATIAFSIDSMLPALPQIAAELSPNDVNKAQLVLTSFVLGMGIGTFFTGPLSDTFGRKPVILAGSALYIAAAAYATVAQGMEMLLLARVLQGLGAAAPRIAALALVRDLYAGREMARIMSFAMMVFTLVPAVAPMMGAGIIAIADWRSIFLAFVVFSLISSLWLGLRQPESLPVDKRRPMKLAALSSAAREMWDHPTVRLSILAQTLCFAMLFMMISLIQPVFDVVFDRAHSFHFWFAAMALISGGGSLLNAWLVMRVGMRRLATMAVGIQVVLATGITLLILAGLPEGYGFYIFFAWCVTIFLQISLTLGNLNAITMEPMGHIAGAAASVSGGVSTVIGAALAAPVGLMFNGTPLPLTIGVGITSGLALLTLIRMQKVETRMAQVA